MDRPPRPPSADPRIRVGFYVWLWNRGGAEGLELDGDDELPALWREHVKVRWS